MVQSDLVRLAIVSIIIVVAGLGLCSPLYSSLHDFVRSSLFVKVLMWVPILLLFTVFMQVSAALQSLMVFILMFVVAYELFIINKSKGRHVVKIVLFLLISGGLVCSILALSKATPHGAAFLLSVGFASVMSDVFAFFFGNYIGMHKLPSFINHKKSWEGVIGQFVGAGVGIVIVDNLILHSGVEQSLAVLAILVGLGSATGDILNSFVKRKASVKDWSNKIPGHGGYSDRLSSLSLAILISYIFVYIF